MGKCEASVSGILQPGFFTSFDFLFIVFQFIDTREVDQSSKGGDVYIVSQVRSQCQLLIKIDSIAFQCCHEVNSHSHSVTVSQCHSVTVSTSYKTPQNWFYFSVATRWTSREGSEGEKTEAPGPVSKIENLFQLKKIYHMCTAIKYPLKCILTQSFYFITVDIGWSGCPISFT